MVRIMQLLGKERCQAFKILTDGSAYIIEYWARR